MLISKTARIVHSSMSTTYCSRELQTRFVIRGHYSLQNRKGRQVNSGDYPGDGRRLSTEVEYVLLTSRRARRWEHNPKVQCWIPKQLVVKTKSQANNQSSTQSAFLMVSPPR